MVFSPRFTCRLLIGLFVALVCVVGVPGGGVAYAEPSTFSSLHIQPITDITAHAGERIKIHAQVEGSLGTPGLSFVWEQRPGASLDLRDDMTDTVYFIAPRVEIQTEYQLIVLVSDGITQAHEDVRVVVLPYQASLPIADAGSDQNVKSGDAVTLDASASSDQDSLALTYSWKQVLGPNVVFAPTQMSTHFVAPIVDHMTVLQFQLMVSDEQGSATDSVQVTVSPDFIPPVSSSSSSPVTQQLNLAKTSPKSVAPLVVLSPSSSTSEILSQSDLRRGDILREAYYACFSDARLDSQKQSLLEQQLLQIDAQDLAYVGVEKMAMLRDVLVICHLITWPISDQVVASHYVDVGTTTPIWWQYCADFAFTHHLFDDQPLFLPNKTMNRSDVQSLLSQIKILNNPVVVSASPDPEGTPYSAISSIPILSLGHSHHDETVSASVLNKTVEPKLAVFGILFLVGIFCVIYGLMYSLRPVRQKQTYISLPNPPANDRR